MSTLTASTGTVNLTTSTGWSPAQIPQNGDDLIIGAATLNLDADLTLNTVTFNNSASRLDFSGTNRTVQATNGWFVTAAINNRLITTTITTGTTLTLIGQWTASGSASSGAGNAFSLIAITGGTANFITVGNNPAGIIFNIPSPYIWRLTTNSGQSGGTINVTGRLIILGANSTANYHWATGGTLNHTSSGTNEVSLLTADMFLCQGSFSLNWTGNLTASFASTSKFISWQPGHSGNTSINGSFSNNGIGYTIGIGTTSGTITLNGKFVSTNQGGTNEVLSVSGNVLYQEQSNTINAAEFCVIQLHSGTLTVSGLNLDVAGKFVVIRKGGVVNSSASTQLTKQPGGQIAACFTNAIDARILEIPISGPTLPAVQNVAAGTVYGYTGFDQTGTGLIIDPAVLASAISANIPDIIDGVHEADTRDYDDIPGSIGWKFKKLRQANPLVEFTVTNNIVPIATEFAVNITETHDDGSFEDSVLYFENGPLAYDNNAILSLEKFAGYSVITLQRPLRIAPTVGNKGIIDPLSHVHSIEAIQEGLALETTSQSILTAIGDIPTALDPNDIESIRDGLALETTSQSILTAIGEIDVDFGPILDRLPEELEDGRMAAVISNTQVSGIQTTIINALKRYEVS